VTFADPFTKHDKPTSTEAGRSPAQSLAQQKKGNRKNHGIIKVLWSPTTAREENGITNLITITKVGRAIRRSIDKPTTIRRQYNLTI
jgi:hypothetical protein